MCPSCILVIRHSFECTFNLSKPYRIRHPASSSLLDQPILFFSSNLARSSTSTSTSLPFSAARIRASTTLLSFATRYSVIFRDTTSGSSAASYNNRKNGFILSYGKNNRRSFSWTCGIIFSSMWISAGTRGVYFG